MTEPQKNNGRIIIAIFVVLAVATIAATLISNFGMWGNYDTIEAEEGIAPEDAIPQER